jgi:voltage-gated potassium channel
MMFIVFVNITAFLCSSVQVFHDYFGIGFVVIEAISVVIFTVEFLLRLYVSTERKSLRKKGPFWGRVFYCLRLLTIFDILSFLPFWPLVFAQIIVPSSVSSIDKDILIIVRILRLVALAKIDRYSSGLKIFLYTLYKKRSALFTSFLLSLGVMILTASMLWWTETFNPAGSLFPSIPSAIYMSILMLTQMDYPQNPSYWTNLVVSFTSVLSLYIFGMPVAMLSDGFKFVAQEFNIGAANVVDGSESDTTDCDENPDGQELIKQRLGESVWCAHCDHCRKCLIELETQSYTAAYKEVSKTLSKQVLSLTSFRKVE